MPDSYPFNADYSKNSLEAAYTFTTKRDIFYRVYFIEVTKLIEIFDDYPVISNAMYMGVDLLTDKTAFLDAQTGYTISQIVKDYLDHYDKHTILVYNCYDGDNKQALRNMKFHRWYDQYLSDLGFELFDKKFLDEDEQGNLTDQYLTLMYSKTHKRIDKIREEIGAVSKWMDEEKD